MSNSLLVDGVYFAALRVVCAHEDGRVRSCVRFALSTVLALSEVSASESSQAQAFRRLIQQHAAARNVCAASRGGRTKTRRAKALVAYVCGRVCGNHKIGERTTG